ncbi:MAG: hypothetical protein R2799_13340 [Crocinitomicaceae bacterium]
MDRLEEKAFKFLPIQDRLNLILHKGDFCGKRRFLGNEVKLYQYKGEFIEVWSNIARGCVFQIEIQRNKQILFEYVKDLKI